MNQSSVTMAKYIYNKMKPYRIGLPIIFSVMIGIFASCSIIFLRANSDYHLLKAISGHLSLLVEGQDRPEIQRLLTSISNERNVKIVLTQNENALASTGDVIELDQKFIKPSSLIDFGKGKISASSLFSEIKIKRPNGPELNSRVYIFSPIAPILASSGLIALVFLLCSLVLSQWYARRVTSALHRALRPIEELDLAIKEITNLSSEKTIAPIGIVELDHIRSTILETKRALEDATHRAGESKAKDLLAQSYQRLIHDLYTPVAALREAVSSASENKHNPLTLEKENQRISRLAEQVLSQIISANQNLEHEAEVLAEGDVRICIMDAIEQSLMASPKNGLIKFKHNIPDSPIIIPHSPKNLRRAVSNLLSNAISACNTTVELKIETKNSSISIHVSDDGAGINSDEVSLFLQGRLTSRNGNRPSLGLPSANHIARMHGGRVIHHKNTELGGASFEIRI